MAKIRVEYVLVCDVCGTTRDVWHFEGKNPDPQIGGIKEPTLRIFDMCRPCQKVRL